MNGTGGGSGSFVSTGTFFNFVLALWLLGDYINDFNFPGA